MQPTLIDLSPLLKQIEREIADADRALRTAQIRYASALAERRGVMRAVESMQQQLEPVRTNGRVD